MRTKVKMNTNGLEFKKDDIGYIEGFVSGADNVPYVVICLIDRKDHNFIMAHITAIDYVKE